MSNLRDRLVAVALEWERAYINAPSITTAISEYDAAVLLGLSDAEYSEAMKGVTSVQKGYDFRHGGEFGTRSKAPAQAANLVARSPGCRA